MKKISANLLFFFGWILSPFTMWNDPFVNFPIAYVAASLVDYFFPGTFGVTTVIAYWATNIAGIAMVYAGSRDVFRKEFDRRRMGKWLCTVLLYSAVMALLSKGGLLRPLASLVHGR